MAHAASRQHGGGSLRRLLSKQTNPLNRKHGNPHRRAALLTNTFVPMVRRKEVADSRLSPGSKCRAERNRTGHRNCHPCRMGKVFRRGGHRIGWGFLCCIRQVRERQPKPETAGGSNFRYHPQGLPPHRLSPVVRPCRGVGGSRSRIHQAVVTFVITHFVSLDCYTQE